MRDEKKNLKMFFAVGRINMIRTVFQLDISLAHLTLFRSQVAVSIKLVHKHMLRCLLDHFRTCVEEVSSLCVKSSPSWKGGKRISLVLYFWKFIETILAFPSRAISSGTCSARKYISPWKNSRLPGNVYSKITLKRNTSTHVSESEWFLLLLLAIY